MDIMNLLSSAPIVANVSQLTGNAGNNGNAVTGGEAVFQKQLLSIIGTQTPESTEQENTSHLQSLLISNSDSLAAPSEELTEEGLMAIIDQLLDQLDQLVQLDELNDVELTGEQQALLQSLLQQVTALVEILSASSEGANHNATFTMSEQTELAAASNSNHSTVIKLADQLLLLQQTLQQNSNKVLFAQTANVLVHEQLQVVQAKINELLNQVKLKANEQAGAAQAVSSEELNSKGDAASHLQRMTQEASYTTAASKATENQSQVNSENPLQRIVQDTTTATTLGKTVEAAANPTTGGSAAEQTQVQPILPEFQLRGESVKDFLTQLAKNTTGAQSAYVLADEFADTMKELIVQRFNVSALNGVTEARLSLTPEHLGHVDVKISMQNGILTAVFQTENAMARDALENQMVQLRASLAQQGITVEKIEVSQMQLASQLNQGQKQGSHNNPQGENQSGSRNKEDTFEEELLSNVTNQELGFGRAVNEVV